MILYFLKFLSLNFSYFAGSPYEKTGWLEGRSNGSMERQKKWNISRISL